MAMPGNVLARGTLFNAELIGDLVNKVQGKSSLAQLSKQTPLSFNGNKEFTFTMDSEVAVVAESGAKTHGGVTVAPVTIVPIKVEYGARVTDEFMYSAEDQQLNILKAFNDGFAKKVARGLDLMALHGVNPRSGDASVVIGANNFDSAITSTIVFNQANPEANIEAAISAIRAAGGDVSGIIMSPTFSAALAAMTNGVGGPKLFPELAWGGNPTSLNGMAIDINKTVSDMSAVDRAIVGDFTNSFKWGYAKEIPMEVIQYGDPDGSGCDLKAYNQVYLRAEIYLGWGILGTESFARIVEEAPATPLTVVLKKGTALNTTATDAVTPVLAANNSYLYKINGAIPRVNTVLAAGTDGWVAYTAGADIIVQADQIVALAEVVSATGAVVKGGTVKAVAASIKLS